MIAPSARPELPSVPPQPAPAKLHIATPEDESLSKICRPWHSAPGALPVPPSGVRERFPIDKSLSLIAEVDGTPAGCVWMTPISVGGIDGYMLGPLATHPNFRKRGIGKLLAREVTRLRWSVGRAASSSSSATATIIARSAGSRRRRAPSNGPARSTRAACLSMLRTRPSRPASRARSQRLGPSGTLEVVFLSAADELIERIRLRLLPSPEAAESLTTLKPDWMPEGGFPTPPRDAAVLIALVRRGEALSVLYTERSPELRSHSGQIAFPGGKIDPGDAGPGDAAPARGVGRSRAGSGRCAHPRLHARLFHRHELSDHAGWWRR